MVALFSYEATQPEDLAFLQGDVIQVVSMGKCYSQTVGVNLEITHIQCFEALSQHVNREENSGKYWVVLGVSSCVRRL